MGEATLLKISPKTLAAFPLNSSEKPQGPPTNTERLRNARSGYKNQFCSYTLDMKSKNI